MMCAGLELAGNQEAGSRREVHEQRLEVLQRLERLWALANVLARAEAPLSGLRGVSYARRALAQLEDQGADATAGDYKLLSRQVPYGAVGMYGVVADGFRLFDRQTLTLTPGRGERLGDAFLDETQVPGPVKQAARDGTPVKLATLKAWGERCHLDAEPGAEERACLREALEENQVRLRMARRLAQVPRQEDEPEQARLARILQAIGDDPEDADLAQALRAILAYERSYRLIQLVLERLLWRARTEPGGRATREGLKRDPVLAKVCDRLPSAAAELHQALQAETLAHAQDFERIRDAAEYVAQAASRAGSPLELADAVHGRHADVQRGKVSGGRPKAPWLERGPTRFTLSLTRAGGAGRELEDADDVGSHPYRLYAADALVAAAGL